MTATLVLRVAAPLQSWGVRSELGMRDSLPHPTKSGVIGLIAAAMGRDRSDNIDDLAACTMHVRIDRPGVIVTDWQTAGGGSVPLTAALLTQFTPAKQKALTAGWTEGLGGTGQYVDNGVVEDSGHARNTLGSTVTMRSQILMDAAFLVTLTFADVSLARHARAALLAPQRLIWLGRKAFPPTDPLVLGDDVLMDVDPLTVLSSTPCVEERPGEARTTVEAVLECGAHDVDGNSGVRALNDQPISFDRDLTDRYNRRFVRSVRIDLPLKGMS